MRFQLCAGATLLALAATSCTGGGGASTRAPSPAVRERPVAAALTAFGDCTALTTALRKEALAEVTAYGLSSTAGSGTADRQLAFRPVNGLLDAAAKSVAAAAPDVSQTNDQESGVDEPDQVKTDGKVMVISVGHASHLEVLDVTGTAPRQTGDLLLHLDDATLLMDGSTVVALGQAVRKGRVVTVAEVVDVSDPAAPRAVRRFRLDGSLVDARFVHGRVVLAVRSTPDLTFTSPRSGARAEQLRTLRLNRRAVGRATVDQLLPSVSVTPGGRTLRADCTHALRSGVASGISRTSLITLDPGKADPTQHVTVIGDTTTVYASTNALYLTTSPWTAGTGAFVRTRPATTDVHGFDVSRPDHLSYLGTGAVPGSLPDQYALSEQAGYLRVATTVAASAGTDTRITVLTPTGGVLKQVGQVGGLGIGEQVGGVRYLGTTAYVVTFARSNDPLYVVDLADPTRPALRGQVELTGFSTALFPLGKDLLLGLGEGSANGQFGTQATTFDTSDPGAPTLASQLVLGQTNSLAERDHHALLWLPKARELVLPLTSYGRGAVSGATVLHVAQDGTLNESGRIPAHLHQGVTRVVQVGDLLYSVSDGGVTTTPLERLADSTWHPFQ